MEKSDFCTLPDSEEEIGILDADWNDHVMWCYRTAEMRLRFSVMYEENDFLTPEINLLDLEKAR